MELTDSDKQRIEQKVKQFAKNKFEIYTQSMVDALFEIAEYATKYERKIKEKFESNAYNLYKLECDKVRQLRAERTELRNKVIEEIAAKLSEFDLKSMSHMRHFLNSLKK